MKNFIIYKKQRFILIGLAIIAMFAMFFPIISLFDDTVRVFVGIGGLISLLALLGIILGLAIRDETEQTEQNTKIDIIFIGLIGFVLLRTIYLYFQLPEIAKPFYDIARNVSSISAVHIYTSNIVLILVLSIIILTLIIGYEQYVKFALLGKEKIGEMKQEFQKKQTEKEVEQSTTQTQTQTNINQSNTNQTNK